MMAIHADITRLEVLTDVQLHFFMRKLSAIGRWSSDGNRHEPAGMGHAHIVHPDHSTRLTKLAIAHEILTRCRYPSR